MPFFKFLGPRFVRINQISQEGWSYVKVSDFFVSFIFPGCPVKILTDLPPEQNHRVDSQRRQWHFLLSSCCFKIVNLSGVNWYHMMDFVHFLQAVNQKFQSHQYLPHLLWLEFNVFLCHPIVHHTEWCSLCDLWFNGWYKYSGLYIQWWNCVHPVVQVKLRQN